MNDSSFNSVNIYGERVSSQLGVGQLPTHFGSKNAILSYIVHNMIIDDCSVILV